LSRKYLEDGDIQFDSLVDLLRGVRDDGGFNTESSTEKKVEDGPLFRAE
jgi:hypothetical protein